MKKYIVSLMTAMVLVLGACELDREPFDSVTSENIKGIAGLESATRGVYSYMKNEYFVKPYHYIPEFGGDNISLSGTTSDPLMTLYNYNRIVSGNWHLEIGLWPYTYQMVVTINRSLEMAEEGTSSEVDQVLGENYYLRGFLYFNLVQAFGRPYTQSPQTNLGVPLKLTSDENDFPPRATVAEVYEQVIEDLQKGASLMNVPKENIYATKEAAWALLSRVYLYMEDWEKAEAYSDSVINSNRFALLDNQQLGRYFTMVPEDNSETILAIRTLKDKDHLGWWSVGSMYANVNGIGWGEMYASKPYRDLLGKHPEDARHAFVEPQYTEDNKMWFLFVEDYDDDGITKYMFRNREVVNDNGQWLIVKEEGDDEVISEDYVQEELNGEGETSYYITWRGEKEYVEIGRKMEMRQGYPKYYVLKCSGQEDQAHLWSPVISRLAEMYLNRAEARYHQGNEQGAIDDVNIIRRRAGIPEWTMAGLPDGKSVLDIVLEERRLELAFEGHRKNDIFRKGRTLDRRYPGTHDRGASNMVKMMVESTDPAVIQYIPQQEIDRYPSALQQNP
ncbi:RagB/SusD family nutrient uptake outer membrane protein [Marinilabilia rubra]|uniref:RagB/SusD family nutrient uptake outer membrane protein n=1 Tax=Marinilabilia rubra TaxID=2162893 RepID=A0A2U2B768_9BACT|nr:RagB/SusD family nutrient uptake outer membrane protein [Marinilabilia rubra]PWD98883.1 RagB/SusD family nutrient uptake outer membrane protein [Marinilabilia rubra]